MEILRQPRVAAIVAEVTSAIATATDLDTALRALLHGVHLLTGATIGGVRLLEAIDQPIGPSRVFYFGGQHDGEWHTREILAGSDIARVLATGRGEYSADLTVAAAAGDEAAQRALVFREIHSSLIVPLRVSGRVIGTLHADSHRPHAFREEQLLPLQLLADLAAGAVEQARWQQEAQEREASLAVAQRIAHLGSWEWNVVSGALWWSDEQYRMFGYTPGAFKPTYDRFLAAIVPAERRRIHAAVQLALTDRRPYETTFPIRRPDGTERIVHAQGEVRRDAAGTPLRMTGTTLDVTERTHAAVALARQFREADVARSTMRAIFDATEEAIGLLAPDGRVLMVNRLVEEWFGLAVDRVVGQNLRDLREELRTIFDDPAAFQTGQTMVADRRQRIERSIQQHWPVERQLALYSTPVHTTDGDLLGRLFSFRDVTRERQAERLKDEFIAMVSHELRTPLTSIKGYIDLLLDDQAENLSPQQREFLSIVQQNTDREVALVNNLLDLSRLEAGQVQLRHDRVALPAILQNVATAFRPLVDPKQQQLRLAVAPDLPEVVGDGERLTQVFTNLVSNAHKYTPPGGRITVSAVAKGAAVRVDVKDTGVGLTAEEQQHLFTRFYRADNRATRMVGGSGLGLVIAQALVERHGGSLTVRSAPGAGSTFSVTLPADGDLTEGQSTSAARTAAVGGAEAASAPPNRERRPLSRSSRRQAVTRSPA